MVTWTCVYSPRSNVLFKVTSKGITAKPTTNLNNIHLHIWLVSIFILVFFVNLSFFWLKIYHLCAHDKQISPWNKLTGIKFYCYPFTIFAKKLHHRCRPASFLKKRLRHRCFLVNFLKVLRYLFHRTPPDCCFCKYAFGQNYFERLIEISMTIFNTFLTRGFFMFSRGIERGQLHEMFRAIWI